MHVVNFPNSGPSGALLTEHSVKMRVQDTDFFTPWQYWSCCAAFNKKTAHWIL